MEELWGPLPERSSEPTAAPQASGTTREMLRMLCTAALRDVPADGVAVSVISGGGHAELVHATDSVAARLDELQFALGEGPAHEAFRHGFPVLVPTFDGEARESGSGRWPGFVRAAAELGVGAIFALPLQLGATRLGALVLYRKAEGPLGREGMRQALRFSDAITLALIDSLKPSMEDLDISSTNGAMPPWNMVGTEEEVNDHLETAQHANRAVVHQAVGMVAHQLGIGVDEALARIRATAYAQGESLLDIAHRIVAREVRLEP